MAERSFAKEVRDLELGAGQEFRGEGILAITKALLQSGVGYVGGYQGAPISHLMDVLADAQDMLAKLGVQFSVSASEAAAAASLAASVMYPIRGAVTFKSTARHQCRLRRARQPGIGRRQRWRADHHRRGLRRRLLDHAGALARLRHEVADLAARSATQPGIDRQGGRGRLRIVGSLEHAGDAGGAHSRLPRARQLHRQGQQAAAIHAAAGAGKSRAATSDRIVLPPASFVHEKEKIEKRWPAAVEFHQAAQAQRSVRRRSRRGRHHHPGRHVQRRDPRARSGSASPTSGARRACRSM